jgi:hypothetical protein
MIMSDLSGFVYYNEIRDYIGRRESSKNRKIGGKVRAKKKRNNNNKR